MEKYLNISIDGFNYIIKYTGDVEPTEIEDAFVSYLDSSACEDATHEEIVSDVMNSFGNIKWEKIPAYNMIF